MRAPLKPLDEALAELLAQALPLAGDDTVDCFDADGRVLRADAVSPLQVPPQDNSAMDGYAVRSAECTQGNAELPSRSASPQAPWASRWPWARWRASSRGSGARRCRCHRHAGRLRSSGRRSRAHQGAARGRAMDTPLGRDIRRGATVIAAGTRLSPAELGLAASIGLASLRVARKPRVALFSTGDELVMPGTVAPEQMPPGSIYNSNRFFLRALLQRMGCEVTDFGIVPDRREATVDALREAARAHDLILTSGGVSVGEEDHVKPAVQALGQLDLWQIAVKPGKPFAYGRVNREGEGFAHFIGLPGNPVSSFVTFLLLVRPSCCACRACSRRCRARSRCAPTSIGLAGTSAANSCACATTRAVAWSCSATRVRAC